MIALWHPQCLFGRLQTILLLLAAATTATAADPPDAPSAKTWTLPEAVAFALENNPNASIAAQRLEAARAELDRARAAYTPVLSIGTSYGLTDTPGQAFNWILNQRAFEEGTDFNRPGTIDNWNTHAAITWSLYDGGRRAGSKRAAEAGAEARLFQQEVARHDIALGVTRAFLQILQAEEAIHAVEAQLTTLDAAIEAADARVEQGAMLESEALHIRVEHARTREDLLRARHADALARRAFIHFLGLPYAAPTLAQNDIEKLIPLPPEEFPLRPELEVARGQREAADAAVAVAKAENHPRVELFGRIDHDEGWRTDGSGESWSTGIALRYDLWDGGARSGDARAARARLREAREQERKMSLLIEYEVEQARLAREEARLRVEVTDDSLKLAEENARLARSRFNQGALLATQLTEAETALTGARVRHTHARTDLAAATATLRRALGFFPIANNP